MIDMIDYRLYDSMIYMPRPWRFIIRHIKIEARHDITEQSKIMLCSNDDSGIRLVNTLILLRACALSGDSAMFLPSNSLVHLW